ncbi:hypothetical protein ACGRHY_27230 [Streptomyces sp. HK10]|uniref:hypothetical protein n=1 Tax=Streptomyces sp. HK10 TaxID=3373255 RepID=UPI0037494D35
MSSHLRAARLSRRLLEDRRTGTAAGSVSHSGPADGPRTGSETTGPDRQTGPVDDIRAVLGPQLPDGFSWHLRPCPAPVRDDPTQPGPDELRARDLMLTAIARFGWERYTAT